MTALPAPMSPAMSGRRFVVAGLVLLLVAGGCTGGDEEPDAAGVGTSTPASATTASASPTPRPQGEILTVTSIDDDGPGTLRQLLLDAQPGDTILFDPAVFPPDDPQTIAVEDALPQIGQDYLTIDASGAGVILDGALLPEDSWLPGLEILADHNTVRGLQVVNFTGTGIVVALGGRNNTIGGDRSVGAGPVGQGNLTAGNDVGIGVWDRAAGNVVTGNLIGTDVHGEPDLGNASSGVWVDDATDNLIGPDNVITSSARCGIQVGGGSSGNTLTRNSIHDNVGAGICLSGARPAAPLVSDLDTTGGLVTGTACGGCHVEVFSDDGEEGATYEGDAVADSSGAFSFDKGSGFAKPNVTLTATDAEGNTSRFSRPSGPATVLTLQEGNRHPKSALQAKASGDLADNRVATMLYVSLADNPEGLWGEIVHAHESIRDELLAFGISRLDTALFEVEPPIDWTASEHDFPAEYDRLIDEMADSGVTVNYLLHFWDKEGEGEALSTPRFKTESQVEDFLDYVRFVVRRFKGRVDTYTIWSEPDNCEEGGGIKCIEPNDYIELARQVVPVIREEDPQAKVAAAPNVLFYDHYQGGGPHRGHLRTLLSSDVVSMFDEIHWHGLYNVTPNNTLQGAYYYDYPSIVEEIKETAEAHGFRGEYWSTEMGWCSAELEPECSITHGGVIEKDKHAAKYYGRGILMNLGMDVGVGVGGPHPPHLPWSYSTIVHLNTIMAGARPTDLAVNISGDATRPQTRSYAFKMPGGDTLFAVWKDGTAVDEDPGLVATLTFPGLSASSVVGIDVLYGFEQGLIAETVGGDLIIRDVLVRDYPTILRLEP